MYRGVIQHLQYQSEYLKNQIRARGLVEPIGLGRIYRVVHDTTTSRRAARAVGEDAGGAGARAGARERLVARHGAAAARRARRRLGGAGARRARRPALATRGRGCTPWRRSTASARSTRDGAARAARRRAGGARRPAIRVAEPWLAKAARSAGGRRVAAGHRSRAARALAAGGVAGGVSGRRTRRARRRSCSARHGRDPFVVDGVVSSLSGLEHQALARLLARPGAPEDALGDLAGAVARGGDAAAVADLWTRIADARRPVAERLALARGTELALGTESFGVRTARRLSLAAAPQPLLGRAHEGGEIDALVARVLDGMDWPGKPRKVDDGRAADRRRAAALRRRQGDLRPALRRLPPAGRARPRRPGAGAGRLAVRDRPRRDHGAHRDPRQGREGDDAAARHAVRRRDRRRC